MSEASDWDRKMRAVAAVVAGVCAAVVAAITVTGLDSGEVRPWAAILSFLFGGVGGIALAAVIMTTKTINSQGN